MLANSLSGALLSCAEPLAFRVWVFTGLSIARIFSKFHWALLSPSAVDFRWNSSIVRRDILRRGILIDYLGNLSTIAFCPILRAYVFAQRTCVVILRALLVLGYEFFFYLPGVFDLQIVDAVKSTLYSTGGYTFGYKLFDNGFFCHLSAVHF